MRDPDAKATMLEIVQKYEAMADRAARREIFGMFLIDRLPESKSDSLERFGRSRVPASQPRAKPIPRAEKRP
jgi:hypothetical protein